MFIRRKGLIILVVKIKIQRLELHRQDILKRKRVVCHADMFSGSAACKIGLDELEMPQRGHGPKGPEAAYSEVNGVILWRMQLERNEVLTVLTQDGAYVVEIDVP